MDNSARTQKEMLEKLPTLPINAQKAFTWFVKNYKALEPLLEGKLPGNIESVSKKAMDEEDFYLYILLLFQQLK